MKPRDWALVWLGGVAVLAVWHAEADREDIAVMLVWPVIVPAGLALRAHRKIAYTCRDCGGYYGDREHMELHKRVRYKCVVPPTEGETDA